MPPPEHVPGRTAPRQNPRAGPPLSDPSRTLGRHADLAGPASTPLTGKPTSCCATAAPRASGPSRPTTPTAWSASTSRCRTSRSTTASSRPTRGCPPRTSTASPTTTSWTGWDSRPRSAASSSPPSATTASTPRACPPRAPADEAEVAFLVQDAHQGRGVASALLEHIAAVARERGIRRFAAEVLPANSKMIKVFTDAGYTAEAQLRGRRRPPGVRPGADRRVAGRAARAGSSGPRRAPCSGCSRRGSVAVIGAGRAPGGSGPQRPAQPPRRRLHRPPVRRERGLRRGEGARRACRRTAPSRDIPEPVDLAVVAVPAERVPEAVADCGEHGVQGLVVVCPPGTPRAAPKAGSGSASSCARRVRTGCGSSARTPSASSTPPRRCGSTPRSRPRCPRAGRIGLFAQSGAIGIALLSPAAPARRRGHGRDRRVHVHLLRQPRGRVRQRRPPVLVRRPGHRRRAHVPGDPSATRASSPASPGARRRQAGRGRPGRPAQRRRAPGPRRAGATRLPHARSSALLRQAGVIRVDTITELVDAGLLLAASRCPPARGWRSSATPSRSGCSTYDACLAEGLRPLPPMDLTTAATADGLPRRAGRRRWPTTAATPSWSRPSRRWGRTALRRRATATPWRTALARGRRRARRSRSLVVHVELGGLAEGRSRRPPAHDRPRTAASRPRRRLAAQPPHPRGPADRPGRRCRDRPHPSAAADSRRIPAYPAAERAVRALAEAVAVRASGAARPPTRARARVRGHRREAAPAPRSTALLPAARGTPGGLTLGPGRRRCPARAVRHRRTPYPARAHDPTTPSRRRPPRLPRRAQDHRPPSAPPRRPRRRTAGPGRRGATAPGVRRVDRAPREARGAAPGRAGDGAARRRHRRTCRHRPGRRRGALLRARRAPPPSCSATPRTASFRPPTGTRPS